MIAAYDKLIYFNEASKYTILRMRTDDPNCSRRSTFPIHVPRPDASVHRCRLWPAADGFRQVGDRGRLERGQVRPAAPCRALARACAADNGRTSELSFIGPSQGHWRKHGQKHRPAVRHRRARCAGIPSGETVGDPRHHGAEAGGDQDVLRRKPRHAGYYGAADTVSGHASDGDEDLSAFRPRLHGYPAEKSVPALRNLRVRHSGASIRSSASPAATRTTRFVSTAR